MVGQKRQHCESCCNREVGFKLLKKNKKNYTIFVSLFGKLICVFFVLFYCCRLSTYSRGWWANAAMRGRIIESFCASWNADAVSIFTAFGGCSRGAGGRPTLTRTGTIPPGTRLRGFSWRTIGTDRCPVQRESRHPPDKTPALSSRAYTYAPL